MADRLSLVEGVLLFTMAFYLIFVLFVFGFIELSAMFELPY